jgi:hypothetical protein
MEARLLCEHFSRHFLQKTAVESVLHTYWTSVGKFLRAEQKSSMQVLESSNNYDHADGNVERRGIGAPREGIGDDSNVGCLNAPHASHAVAQVAFHSHVASHVT